MCVTVTSVFDRYVYVAGRCVSPSRAKLALNSERLFTIDCCSMVCVTLRDRQLEWPAVSLTRNWVCRNGVCYRFRSPFALASIG